MGEDLPCYGMALGSAVLLRLAFPWPGLWPLAWVALVPLMMSLRARPGRRALFIAWIFGAAFSYLNVVWLSTLVQFNPFIPVGIAFLGMAMGVWVAVAGWGWSLIRDRYGALLGGLLAAAWWAGTEWLRTLGPMSYPWGLLGTSQQPSVALIQTLSIAGVYGLTFLIVVVNGFAADWMLARLSGWELKRHPSTLESPAAFALIAQALRWSKVRLAVAVVVVIAIAAWGHFRARSIEARARESATSGQTLLHVSILQPNVMQKTKWDSYADPDPNRRLELQRDMFIDLLAQLDALAESGAKPDLVITPESAVTTPYFSVSAVNDRVQDELLSRAADLAAPILLGADDVVLYNRDGKPTTELAEAVDPATEMPWNHDMFVSAWLLPPHRTFDASAVYHKTRLVPFGEYVPWLHVIPGFQEHIVQVGSFTPGSGPVVFTVPVRHGGWQPGDSARSDRSDRSDGSNRSDPAEESRPPNSSPNRALDLLSPPQIRLATSICFESVYSDHHRAMARSGADLLVNITNDAWYGRTSGPNQHLQICVLRAVETGRPLIRCANTGITVVVSPAGRILERLPFYEQGTLNAEIAVAKDAPQTLYTRWGDWWAIGCLLLGVAALLGELIARKRRPAPARQEQQAPPAST